MSWLHLHDIVQVYAQITPDKLAFKDQRRSITFKEFNERTSKLANAFLDLGLQKGDRISVLLNNSIEFVEIYVAAAKSGLVIVPINFRLTAKEGLYIAQNSGVKAAITEKRFIEITSTIREEMEKLIGPTNFICTDDASRDDHLYYEMLIDKASDRLPSVNIEDEDPWIILYTSGTTGVPKGVVRSHRSYTSFFLINAAEFSFTPNDHAFIIMPLAHVNSTFYTFVFTYIGASVFIGKEWGFDPEDFLRIVDQEEVTYTSLVPTHYTLILNLPEEIKTKYDTSSLVTLLTSSAPIRKKTKLKVMEFFPNAKLFEAYGSTEAGLVTTLRPEDQFKKLGSIGRECVGSDRIRLLDPDTREPVPEGEVGELFSRSPMLFTEYLKMPEKTAESIQDGFFTARDMARRDSEGYYYLVDRKDNMIITGGEKAFPSEIEEVISSYPGVEDVAVIGVPHEIWGEAVKAVVIPLEGHDLKEKDILEYCSTRLAGYKKPKTVDFITRDEMPRTSTGKILHRILRERYTEKTGD
ncbi:MAG: class I adenylate-forming enzyme family protein [Candidatus Odinarchaeota archaeon]